MANLNRVFLIGNLTRDPEVRYLSTGKPVADLQMAINRRYKTASGEAKEDTCYVGVVVWDRQAETAAEYLKKGSSIFVEGSLRYEQWESNGEKRNRLKVNADRIQFLDSRGRRTDSGDVPDEAPSRREDPAPAAEPSGPPADAKADSDDLPF